MMHLENVPRQGMTVTNLRQRAFWAVDRVRGAQTRAALKTVQRGTATSEPDSLQAKALKTLFDGATESTAAYRPYRNAESLSAFPVIDKNLIRQQEGDFISSKYDPSNLHSASTSGSTGTPFRVLHSHAKRRQVRADAVHFGSLAGFQFGTRLFHLKIWSGRNSKDLRTRFMQNVVPVDVLRFGADEVTALLSRIAATRSPCGIIAYGSALGILARNLDHGPSHMRGSHLTSIIAQSEALPLDARDALSRYFGVAPVGRYGAEEVGIIGQQVGADTAYLINSASIVVEVLNIDNDAPAPPGELGRIVVTDLQNHAMPMIRYDTGDLGRFALHEDGTIDRTHLAVVEGRKLDQIFDANDRPVSSFIFYKMMWRFPPIRQYQIVQDGRGSYLIKINTDGPFDQEQDLLSEFVEHLGPTATVRIERVDELPPLSSGKRRQVVSTYTPAQP